MTAQGQPTQAPDTAILAVLARIEARLDALESRLTPVLDVVGQAPALLATGIDMADAAAARIGDVDERLRAALSLLEKLSEPATLHRLEEGLKLLEGAPGMASMAIDVIDDQFRKAAQAGVDLGALVPALESLSFVGLKAITSPQVRSLLGASLFVERSLQAATAAATALEVATATTHQPLGPVGLWKALTDPHVQRALGMAVGFARAFGVALQEVPKGLPPAPPSSRTLP